MEMYDFSILRLGEPHIKSPILLSNSPNDNIANFVTDDQFILYDINVNEKTVIGPLEKKYLLELAGPREKIFFDPAKVHAAIVTCGGLCPGLNDVIYSIVMNLWHRYGVRRITGIQYGYRGLLPEFGIPTIDLTPDVIAEIHGTGGTLLGSSRGGGEKIPFMVDAIEQMNINVLFAIGGDGTMRGALAISQEARKRGTRLAVIGVPKTIDNDLAFCQRSFGFETAVSLAVEAVESAHVEAHDVMNGIGIVKVMGRESGFIAAHTALASGDVNFVLIPEVPFEIEGEKGLLASIKRRLEKRHHAVILVAEGAGQEFVGQSGETDASGNKKLGDIGLFLRKRIEQYFDELDIEVTVKYIDPSYMIRSAPPITTDSIYCARLGSNAVHAAMAGKTEVLISLVNNNFVHLPIRLAVSKRNKVDPESPLWRDVIDRTGQPLLLSGK
jgi:6-phosphofructokinase 1